MITLITGTPGAGKTLYTIAEILTHYIKAGRPLFVQGIPDLALEHSLLPVESEWTESRDIPGNLEGKKAAYYNFPADSVIVIDEAQNTFRPRSQGSKVPDIVAALETHRHTGIDIVLITQHPSRLDSAVRTLVGRHIHIRRMFGWNRAIVYEWDSATDPARVSNAIKRSWAYPKKVFELYKSSTLHTARTNRVPYIVIIAIIAIVGVPVGWYFAFSKSAAMFKPVEKIPGSASTELATARTDGDFSASEAPAVPKKIIEATTPLDDHNPLSAPLYAAVLPPVIAPQITGCISSKKTCICYTQQNTPIWVPDEQCRLRAAGSYYDPYKQPTELVSVDQNQPPQTKTKEAPEAREGSGNSLTVPGVM